MQKNCGIESFTPCRMDTTYKGMCNITSPAPFLPNVSVKGLSL